MQRAIVSVCSNIAEGFGRKSYKENDQFYAMANGLLTEPDNQTLIAWGIGYMSESDMNSLYEQCVSIYKMLVSLQLVNHKKGERN